MAVRLVLMTLVSVLSSSSLFAQTHEMPTTAITATGPVAHAASRQLQQLALEAQNGVRIDRRRNDSVLNGAIIGAAAGVGTGIALCLAMEPWETCNNPGPLARFGALGAAIGIGVDALIRPRETIFMPPGTHVSVAPVVGRATKGLRVAVRF